MENMEKLYLQASWFVGAGKGKRKNERLRNVISILSEIQELCNDVVLERVQNFVDGVRNLAFTVRQL